jgi:hypothetical protein
LIKEPSKFRAHQAQQLTWHTTPTTTYRKTIKKLKGDVQHMSWKWFPNGEISTSYNCIDRHVEAGIGDQMAIIWNSPVACGKSALSMIWARMGFSRSSHSNGTSGLTLWLSANTRRTVLSVT